MSYGTKREQFLQYLKSNGPQTYDHLADKPFWPGVKPRICEFVKKGIIERVEVANDDTLRNRAILTALKYVEGGEFKSLRSKPSEEALSARIKYAINLLEANGYIITKTD